MAAALKLTLAAPNVTVWLLGFCVTVGAVHPETVKVALVTAPLALQLSLLQTLTVQVPAGALVGKLNVSWNVANATVFAVLCTNVLDGFLQLMKKVPALLFPPRAVTVALLQTLSLLTNVLFGVAQVDPSFIVIVAALTFVVSVNVTSACMLD